MKDFVELKEFPNYFIAHSPARLMRLKGDTYLTCSQCPNSKKDNYWIVTVKTVDGKYVKRSMHRLLMQTFVPNPNDKAHINHIDGDKSNNELSNLEWATPKENSEHAVRTGLYNIDTNIKEVHQYFLNGNYIASFKSDVEAEEVTGVTKQNISKVTLGKRVHAGYFQWRREKTPSIDPIDKKYIKNYVYLGRVFNTINELALYLNIKHPDKTTVSRLPKKVRELLTINYYN